MKGLREFSGVFFSIDGLRAVDGGVGDFHQCLQHGFVCSHLFEHDGFKSHHAVAVLTAEATHQRSELSAAIGLHARQQKALALIHAARHKRVHLGRLVDGFRGFAHDQGFLIPCEGY